MFTIIHVYLTLPPVTFQNPEIPGKLDFEEKPYEVPEEIDTV